MTWTLATRWAADGRLNKSLQFATEAEARQRLDQISAVWPEAFVAPSPASGRPEDWVVDVADPEAPTLIHSPAVISDQDRAAAISLAPATFYVALRAALPFSAIDPAPNPGAREDMGAWLLSYIAALDAAAVAAALSVSTPEAEAVITYLLDRMSGATEIDRADPNMDAFGALLGLSPAQTDAVFTAAADAVSGPMIAVDVPAALTALAA